VSPSPIGTEAWTATVTTSGTTTRSGRDGQTATLRLEDDADRLAQHFQPPGRRRGGRLERPADHRRQEDRPPTPVSAVNLSPSGSGGRRSGSARSLTSASWPAFAPSDARRSAVPARGKSHEKRC